MTLLATLKSMRARRSPRRARFVLLLELADRKEPLTVGELSYDGEIWTFAYDEAYKRCSEVLRPVEGFDEVDKTYRSSVLFPFFAVRIPDADRPDVRKKLAEQHIEDPDASDLLRLFGRRVVSSPAFELVPA